MLKKKIKPVQMAKKTKALDILNKLVLKKQTVLFHQVDIKYNSADKEFKRFLAILDLETKFWKTLAKEVKADKKRMVLIKGAKKFIKAHKTLKTVVKAQMALVKAKTAKKGKKTFNKAVRAYNEDILKATTKIAKGMKTYETKANKEIIKGYLKAYKKAYVKVVKFN